ncbi:MAG: hypothetical protein Pg6A_05580 [Termitinemataceae bacterium]|nr:MAG: hypothetical protein Pg6A_05580 [Termitinemataceae bacterium]
MAVVCARVRRLRRLKPPPHRQGRAKRGLNWRAQRPAQTRCIFAGCRWNRRAKRGFVAVPGLRVAQAGEVTPAAAGGRTPPSRCGAGFARPRLPASAAPLPAAPLPAAPPPPRRLRQSDCQFHFIYTRAFTVIYNNHASVLWIFVLSGGWILPQRV